MPGKELLREVLNGRLRILDGRMGRLHHKLRDGRPGRISKLLQLNRSSGKLVRKKLVSHAIRKGNDNSRVPSTHL